MKSIAVVYRFGFCLLALGFLQAVSPAAFAQSDPNTVRKGLHYQPVQACATRDARGNCIEPRLKRSPREVQGRQAQQNGQRIQPRRLEARPPAPRYQPHVQQQPRLRRERQVEQWRPSHRYLERRPAPPVQARQHAAPTHRPSYREAYRQERCQARYGGMRELRPGDSLRKTICMMGRDGTRQAVHKRYRGHGGYYTMKYHFAQPRVFGYGSGWHHRNISTIWIVFDSNDRIVRFLNAPYEDWHYHTHTHTHGHGHHHDDHDYGYAPVQRPQRASVTFSWVWIDW